MQSPVHLEEFKRNAKLQNTALIKQGRLSVMPLTLAQWNEVDRVSRAKTQKTKKGNAN
jgi:predicted RNA-binding protein with PUA-like domain